MLSHVFVAEVGDLFTLVSMQWQKKKMIIMVNSFADISSLDNRAARTAEGVPRRTTTSDES
jgi:hypothetical protein